MLLATTFGLESAAIDEILLNGIKYSFLPEQHRKQLENKFLSELATLKIEHLAQEL